MTDACTSAPFADLDPPESVTVPGGQAKPIERWTHKDCEIIICELVEPFTVTYWYVLKNRQIVKVGNGYTRSFISLNAAKKFASKIFKGIRANNWNKETYDFVN